MAFTHTFMGGVMISMQTGYKLENGISIPCFGYGCYKAEGNELREALLCALQTGYRLVDTASFYKNEKVVGEIIKKSGINREELFIVSKIWSSQFDDPAAALDASLAELGLDYLDGYLLHWPGLNEDKRFKAWEYILLATEKGKIRVPGVSNFQEHHLEGLRQRFDFWPYLNQIEIHPAFQEEGLCNFCQKRKIALMGWSPLGRGNVLTNPVLIKIGKTCQKSPAQVALRWQIQKGYIPLPKSVHSARVQENANIFDFSLTQEQISLIHTLNLPDGQGKIGKDANKYPPE